MTAMTPLHDWLSRPVTRVTLIVVVLGSAMLSAASPWGTPVRAGVLVGLTYAWLGAFLVQLISLGAWAALRDGRWLSRIVPPTALLVIHIVATSAGERLNLDPTASESEDGKKYRWPRCEKDISATLVIW